MPRGGARKGAGRKPKTQKAAGTSSAAPGVPVTPETSVKPVENPHKLSPKELIFVECYTGISKFNASDAYKRAGFKPNRHNAARLITKENVEQAIAKRLGSRLRTLQMDGDEALEGISRIARLQVRDVFDAEGNIKPVHEWDADTADALESVKVVERKVVGADEATGKPILQYTKEIKFHDKLRARELMAKAAGKLVERHGVVGAKGELLKPRRVIVEIDDAQPGAPV